MPADPSRLSIEELRRRYVQDGEPASGHFLNRLRRDRRQAARQLHDLLRRRQEREREERLRLDSMLNFERVLWRSGLARVAGVDEVGIGPLAGPVVAAAVVFPPGAEIAGIDDSKRLDPERREALSARIREVAAVGIGLAEVAEIDRLNVYHAGCLAMRRAVEALPEPPQHLLLDARELPDVPIPQNRFDKGDGIDFSIAAASIVAKTHRDALMERLGRRYPEYGFARHKGYGTQEHQEAIREHGPCEIHRMSFQFIHELCGALSEPFYELRERLWAVESRRHLAAFEEALPEHRETLAEGEYRKLRLMATRRWNTL